MVAGFCKQDQLVASLGLNMHGIGMIITVGQLLLSLSVRPQELQAPLDALARITLKSKLCTPLQRCWAPKI